MYSSRSVTEQFGACAPDRQNPAHKSKRQRFVIDVERCGCHILVHWHCCCIFSRNWREVLVHWNSRCVGHGGSCPCAQPAHWRACCTSDSFRTRGRLDCGHSNVRDSGQECRHVSGAILTRVVPVCGGEARAQARRYRRSASFSKPDSFQLESHGLERYCSAGAPSVCTTCSSSGSGLTVLLAPFRLARVTTCPVVRVAGRSVQHRLETLTTCSAVTGCSAELLFWGHISC